MEGPVVSMVSQYVNLSGSTTANDSHPYEISVDVQLEGLVLAPVTATVAISQRHLVDGTTSEADLITLGWEETELLWPERSPGEPWNHCSVARPAIAAIELAHRQGGA